MMNNKNEFIGGICIRQKHTDKKKSRVRKTMQWIRFLGDQANILPKQSEKREEEEEIDAKDTLEYE